MLGELGGEAGEVICDLDFACFEVGERGEGMIFLLGEWF